jgi:hypothetical protein
LSVGVGASDIQLELGSVASAYEPFTGSTVYPITFPSSAGTVYGGTLTVNKDGTGTLTVNRGYKNLGEQDWTVDSNNGFISSIQGMIKPTESVTTYDGSDDVICSQYQYAAGQKGNIPDKSMRFNAANSNTLYIKDSSYSSATDFKTAMNGVQLVYKLETTVTIPLTAPQVKTLLGVNNIWADTGNILSVTYPADTKFYVDRRISESNASSLEVSAIISEYGT